MTGHDAPPLLVEVTHLGFRTICDHLDKVGESYSLSRLGSDHDKWAFDIGGSAAGVVEMRANEPPRYGIYVTALSLFMPKEQPDV